MERETAIAKGWGCTPLARDFAHSPKRKYRVQKSTILRASAVSPDAQLNEYLALGLLASFHFTDDFLVPKNNFQKWLQCVSGRNVQSKPIPVLMIIGSRADDLNLVCTIPILLCD